MINQKKNFKKCFQSLIGDKMEKIKNKNLWIVILINLFVFVIVNVLFDIKYEQVDDFIIYHLYSGLDGTYNIHGVYIHPLLCFLISLFFRILPMINWHSIFLLVMQFICFTIIGNILLKKHQNGIAIVLYTIWVAIFYTVFLLLIQYTSVAALLILTSLVMMIDKLEKKEKTKIKTVIASFILFTLGIMLRMQSLFIIVPFFALYFVIVLLDNKLEKTVKKDKIIKILQYDLIYLIITIIVYVSNSMMYQSDVYKKYTQYNSTRTTLHDAIYVDYEENKEIFDQIGWSSNDHYLFYTFNFGDENIFSEENLQKILDDKIQKDGPNYLNMDIKQIEESFSSEITGSIVYLFLFFLILFVICLFQKDKTMVSILIFITTIAIHVLFIMMGRSMLRVVIPEYVIGTVLLIYFMNFKETEEIKDDIRNSVILCFIIGMICIFVGNSYDYGYQLEGYQNYRDLISETNAHKENVYLYTVPSLQDRYLAYSVYQMPPKGAFSNLRVLGRMGYVYAKLRRFQKEISVEWKLLRFIKGKCISNRWRCLLVWKKISKL